MPLALFSFQQLKLCVASRPSPHSIHTLKSSDRRAPLLSPSTIATDRATWVIRAKREAVRRHGDRWGLAHDRTTIKLLFRWDILSREERDSALRELSEELHSKCQANPGMGKFRFY